MGYGTLNAIKSLHEHARNISRAIHEQPGVRIALIVADDTTLFYAPSPLLIEAGSDAKQYTNAIKLNLVPDEVSKDMGLDQSTESKPPIGADDISPKKIMDTNNDLVRNPPLKFDIARKVRVFNAQIEFVEFELHNHMISKRKVKIPSDLLGLAKDEKAIKLLHSSFQLIDDEEILVEIQDKKITGDYLVREKEKIVKDFLINIPNYGNVILRSKKEDFEKAVSGLKDDIEKFKKALEVGLQKAIDNNKTALAKALLPAVKTSVPDRWKKLLANTNNPSEDDIQSILEHELIEHFGSASEHLKQIELKLLFKGVTYEMLNDEKFIEVAKKNIPTIRLFDEYDAARQVKKADPK